MRIIFVISVFLLLILACTKNDTQPPAIDICQGVSKSFSSNVNAIIQANCAISGCHGPGSFNGPGELLNYSQIFSARTSIRSSVASGVMPQGSSLSSSQKNSIICWIDSGAPNN